MGIIRKFSHPSLFIALALGFSPVANAQLRIDPSTQEYNETPEAIERGEALFTASCSACHDFSRSGEIGPGLGNTTYRAEKSWLAAFIRNPQAMIEAGDDRATELFERYKTVMPKFNLGDDEIDDVLAYIYSNKRTRRPRRPETTREGALKNPIPEPVAHSGLGLQLEKLVSVPESRSNTPVAKINKLAGVIDEGTHRIFVNDMFGFLYEIIDNEAVLFLDMTKRFPNFATEPGLATGLTSFAFSPDFENNGIFYTNHAEIPRDAVADFPLPVDEPATFQYVITEWKTDPTRHNVLKGQGREILRFDLHGASHCVQEINFDPTTQKGDKDYGLLYIGIGDAAASYRNRPELFDSDKLIWGKILRIDPNGNNAPNGQYGIPEGNPYVEDNGALDEIFASGFRNPNTITWDSKGRLFASDIGHYNIEEINWVEKGSHYGWPRYEGTFDIDLGANQSPVFLPTPNDRKSIPPIVQLDHDEIKAVAGGFICYDENLPELNGAYIFGDIVEGRVFTVDLDSFKQGETRMPEELSLFINGEETTIPKLVKNRRADLRIGQDAHHKLYILSKTSGTIWKVVGTQTVDKQ